MVVEETIKINEMKIKFNVIVGNPPYQDTREKTSDNPIYHLFMDIAYKLSEKVMLITPGRFLFNAGKTPNEWNEKMLNDKHFKVVSYNSKSREVFPDIDLKGGIVITLRDNKQTFEKVNVFSKFKELNSILQNVINFSDFESIESQVYTQNKFDLNSLYKDYPEFNKIIGSDGKEKRLTTSIFVQLPIFTEVKTSKNDLYILGLIKNIRTYRYVPFHYIEAHSNLSKYKVILPKSNGAGTFGEVLSTPLIGNPLVGYTQSFISIGSFNTKVEAEFCLKYLKSKFVRAMLGALKVTQDNNKDVWKYVPLQNFTSESDIDWTKSNKEIDRQLCAKYKLTIEEIEFIETMIKPMD